MAKGNLEPPVEFIPGVEADVGRTVAGTEGVGMAKEKGGLKTDCRGGLDVLKGIVANEESFVRLDAATSESID